MWVLDSFVGTGSTLVACDQTNRNGVGIELTKKWAELAARRTKQYIVVLATLFFIFLEVSSSYCELLIKISIMAH